MDIDRNREENSKNAYKYIKCILIFFMKKLDNSNV